jgi:hypothetical protein
MNIEEERKAFEIDQVKRHPSCDLRRWAEAYRSNIVEAAFQSWLAAKEHAAEMAKPTATVKQSIQTGWWVYYDVYQRGEFKSKEAAEKWLNDRGYRVIE